MDSDTLFSFTRTFFIRMSRLIKILGTNEEHTQSRERSDKNVFILRIKDGYRSQSCSRSRTSAYDLVKIKDRSRKRSHKLDVEL